MFFNGFPLVESKVLTKGTIKLPKRRNKSKRIQKKWNKRYGYNFIDIPSPDVIFFDGKFMGHPKTLKKIINKINEGA